jgi:prohibitin 2
MIRKELTERARDFSIILDDVSITDLSFGAQYTAAVEAKQVAQQEAQRAHFLVDRAIQTRQQRIVQAEGEAAAAMLIGKAVSENQGYLKLRRIDAAKTIATKLATSGNRLYLDSGSLLLNLDSRDFEADLERSMKKKK